MAIGLVTLYTLDRARSGSVLAIRELVGQIDLNAMILLLGVALLTAGVAASLTLGITRLAAKVINKINYQAISLTIIAFIALLVIYFSSWFGLYILVLATMIGITPNVLNIKRSHLMGSLLLPVIIFLL